MKIFSRMCLAATVCCALSLARVAPADTLKEAVEQAVRSNPEVLASTNRRLAAHEAVKQAQGGYFPRVDVNVARGRERLDSADTRILGLRDVPFTRHDNVLTISQMLFDGFAVSSEVSRQQARVESSAYNVASNAEDTALRAISAYLEVLRRQETVAAAQDNLDAHRRIHDMIRQRAEAGVGRRADVDQAQSRLALAQANLRSEESSLRDAQVTYARIIGAPPGSLARPTAADGDLRLAEKDTLATALANHPAIRGAEADVEVAEAQRSVAKAALSPRLDLELTAIRDRDVVHGPTDDNIAMLRLRYNLFSGGSDSARIRQAGFQIEEAREILSRIRREVQEALLQALNGYFTARDRLVSLKQYADSSGATREAYLQQFSIGQRTLLDLLNSENEYFTARASYITGGYAEMASRYRVYAGMGQLLPTLGVPLPATALSAGER